MKLFASDFDNTIYFWDRNPRISEEDKAAISRLRDAGGLFGVCTGRSLVGILKPIEGIIDFDFYILASGAFILDGSLNAISRTCVERDIVIEVYKRFANNESSIIHANDTVYSFNGFYELQTRISSFDEIEGDSFYGVSIAPDDPADVKVICDTVNREYGEYLSAYPNRHIADIVSCDCSKGKAIKTVKDYFGAELTAGIGDSFNDIPMFDYSDVSFTFASSHEDVRKSADHTVDSVSEAIDILMEGDAQ